MTADVTLLESLGSEIMVHFALDATRVDSGDPDQRVGDPCHRQRRTPSGDSILDLACASATTSTVAVAVENLHFFDHATHRAIWDQPG